MKRKTEKVFPDDIQLNSDFDAEETLQLNVSDNSIIEINDNIANNSNIEGNSDVQIAEEMSLDDDASKNNLPSVDQLKRELREIRHKKQYGRVLRSTVYVLLISAACAVLVATIFFPILQIYGSSMEPTLSENEIVIALKTTDFKQGELVAFYVGNKILVKRFIAGPGQWVDIDQEGNVYIDGVLLDEPYLTAKSIGSCNIELPYQVPENKYFVLGDHRETSVDSRNTAVGCIDDDDIVGRLVFRVWPLKKIDTF